MDIQKKLPFNSSDLQSLPSCISSDVELAEVLATVYSATFAGVVAVLFVVPLILRFTEDLYFTFFKPKKQPQDSEVLNTPKDSS